MTSGSPSPTRVLIVEDEYFLADDLVRALTKAGMTTSGPVSNANSAIAELDRGSVDFAVLDINLDGAISFQVAAELRRRHIPFLFLTGYDTSVVPAPFDDAVLLQKPQGSSAVISQIKLQVNAGTA